ncbi:MAG TPA: hypothetical protein VFY45_25775 [Baekduia sp.]|nr:hypothetical protein [Baekduia sp.]
MSSPVPTAGPPFVTEMTLEPGSAVVRAFGILDEATAFILDACLIQLWAEGVGTVDLDLRGIIYADGSAAATLDAWTDRAADEAGDLQLRPPRLGSAN